MRVPPLLLGASLLFWGWQADHWSVGAALALVLESSWVLKRRWELSDQEFKRIWTFCCLLVGGVALFAVTQSNAPSEAVRFWEHPGFLSQRSLNSAAGRAVLFWLSWLPATFYLFVVAQAFDVRERLPLEVISILYRWRRRQAQRQGETLLRPVTFNAGYPFLGVCLVAASLHPADNGSFFWGASLLLVWALWPRRSVRYRLRTWGLVLLMAVGVGFLGQRQVRTAQSYLDILTSQFLARLIEARQDVYRSRTMLGRSGRVVLSDRIIIRVTPRDTPAPELLREASFCSYTNQTWYYGKSENDYALVNETPQNSGIWPLLADSQTNAGAVTIACYLPRGKGLLPLPAGCLRLESLDAYIMHRSDMGAVLVEGPRLVVFEAFRGPKATLDGPPTADDLAVPPNEAPALKEIIEQKQLKGLSRLEQLQAVQRLFEEHYHYSLDLEKPPRGQRENTPLGYFLRVSRRGHCEYFATATVLLLRELGLPTRYSIGYSVHERGASGYVVRECDAHAWCLVWEEQTHRWVDFDTSPSGWGALEAQRASVLRPMRDVFSFIKYELLRLWWGQGNLRPYVLGVLAVVMVVLLGQILWRWRRNGRRGPRRSRVWPGRDSEFYQLEQALAGRGLGRPAEEGEAEWLRRISAQPALAELRLPLQQLLRLHYRYRFDPQGLAPAERQRLREEARRYARLVRRLVR